MNESSTQDAAPEGEPTGDASDDANANATATAASSNPAEAGTAEAAATAAEDGVPVPAAPEELAPAAPEEEPIAPGVDRLGRPAGTARAIPETILGPRPSPMFLAIVSIISFISDIGTKLWAEKKLADYPGYVTVAENHLTFVLAKNKGGAWGLLQGESENVRRPFFLLVSVAAIAFIVTLYRRLQPRQYALKWGLPLVLGGALGNVFDRIRYGYVIDFIDYRADWIKKANDLVGKYYPRHIVTDHWPTFNVADIAICVGVGLMAVDMLTSRRGKSVVIEADVPLELEPEPGEIPVTDPAPEAFPADTSVLAPADVGLNTTATAESAATAESIATAEPTEPAAKAESAAMAESAATAESIATAEPTEPAAKA